MAITISTDWQLSNLYKQKEWGEVGGVSPPGAKWHDSVDSDVQIKLYYLLYRF